MVRRPPKIFAILAAISLALCVGVCALWVHSQLRFSQVHWSYERFQSDGTRAIDVINIMADRRTLLMMLYRDRLPPNAGGKPGGYFTYPLAVDQRPHFSTSAALYNPAVIGRVNQFKQGLAGWGPVRWDIAWPRPKRGPDRESEIYIGISHWLLAVLFAIPPAFAARRIVARRRRNRIGLCPTCGYDLRATPDRCPECGKEAAKSE